MKLFTTPEGRIWLAVIATFLVVVSMGYYTFSSIQDQERPFGYGTVPFVPSKSQYGSEQPRLYHVPRPAATVPPEKRGGGGAR